MVFLMVMVALHVLNVFLVVVFHQATMETLNASFAAINFANMAMVVSV